MGTLLGHGELSGGPVGVGCCTTRHSRPPAADWLPRGPTKAEDRLSV